LKALRTQAILTGQRIDGDTAFDPHVLTLESQLVSQGS